MEVSGINPETNNEFLFYNFIENTPNYILEPWLKKAKQVGYKVKPQYEQAILQKLHISVIPTQAFRSYPPSLFPIKWHWVANL